MTIQEAITAARPHGFIQRKGWKALALRVNGPFFAYNGKPFPMSSTDVLATDWEVVKES